MIDLFIDGTVGPLEARYSEAASATGLTAVLCHPHPQFGGTMNDLVLGALESALLASGISCLRFNFRGVGGSQGSYSDGVGEIDDLVAATTWVRESSVGERIIVVGYSFGGAVALSAQELVAPEGGHGDGRGGGLRGLRSLLDLEPRPHSENRCDRRRLCALPALFGL